MATLTPRSDGRSPPSLPARRAASSKPPPAPSPAAAAPEPPLEVENLGPRGSARPLSSASGVSSARMRGLPGRSSPSVSCAAVPEKSDREMPDRTPARHWFDALALSFARRSAPRSSDQGTGTYMPPPIRFRTLLSMTSCRRRPSSRSEWNHSPRRRGTDGSNPSPSSGESCAN
jgi:hypothetical protein